MTIEEIKKAVRAAPKDKQEEFDRLFNEVVRKPHKECMTFWDTIEGHYLKTMYYRNK